MPVSKLHLHGQVGRRLPLCLDKKALKAWSAHKGWETRRSRERRSQLHADAPVEGGKSGVSDQDAYICSASGKRARILECL